MLPGERRAEASTRHDIRDHASRTPIRHHGVLQRSPIPPHLRRAKKVRSHDKSERASRELLHSRRLVHERRLLRAQRAFRHIDRTQLLLLHDRYHHEPRLGSLL